MSLSTSNRAPLALNISPFGGIGSEEASRLLSDGDRTAVHACRHAIHGWSYHGAARLDRKRPARCPRIAGRGTLRPSTSEPARYFEQLRSRAHVGAISPFDRSFFDQSGPPPSRCDGRAGSPYGGRAHRHSHPLELRHQRPYARPAARPGRACLTTASEQQCISGHSALRPSLRGARFIFPPERGNSIAILPQGVIAADRAAMCSTVWPCGDSPARFFQVIRTA